jgi:predicted ATPase/class 3 adenylate cyclase
VATLPSGTVTFVFTDIESSTRHWEADAAAMDTALARHDQVLRDSVDAHNGVVVKATGDGILAVFDRVTAALDASVDAQRALRSNDLPAARMAVHTGEAFERDGDYFGPALNRAARLMAIGHGGQILVSGATAALAQTALPTDVSLRDMGEHRLRDLAEPMLVFQLVHPALVVEFPALRSIDMAPGNLPRQVASFVGREREIKLLSEMLGARSLVTLTGVGGVGKTRLAFQVAAEVVPQFPDGVWVCELAPISDPNAVWETVASSINARPAPGRALEDVLLEYLEPKRLLLVLDNCEHLLAPVARIVTAINHRCPHVVVLTTSREGLSVSGEQMFTVPSLGVPGARTSLDEVRAADAVQLFSERAREAKGDFELGEQNADAVAQLCRRLDGIPLAIELAAARVRSLPPDELVARLDQRFKLLTRGSRAALERHQTLRHTIDWSYELLTVSERRTLNRLSVFAGGWDLAAAEAVVAGDDIHSFDVPDLLGQLVDKSLVDVDEDESGARYRLLETIRQYAQEQLEDSGETGVVRHAHLRHFMRVTEAAGPHLRSRDQLIWAEKLTRESDNLRAALDFAVETTLPDEALRLIAPLMVTGIPTGWTATDWAETARGIPGANTQPLYPLATAYAAMGAGYLGNAPLGQAIAEEARAAQDRLGTNHLWVYAASGATAFFAGDFDAARHHAGEWLKLAREANDAYEISHALILLASADLTDFDRSYPAASEAVKTSRNAGIASALVYALLVLATVLTAADQLEDYESAFELLEEAIDVGTKLGDHRAVATAVAFQAGIAVHTEDWRTALQRIVSALELHLDAGESQAFGGALRLAAIALHGIGYLQPIPVLMGCGSTRFVSTHSP